MNDVYVDGQAIVYALDRHTGGLYLIEMWADLPAKAASLDARRRCRDDQRNDTQHDCRHGDRR